MNEASDVELLRLLRGLIASNAVKLELDLRRLDHIDSPVGVQADSNIWVYGAIPICALAFWRLGAWAGAAAIALSVAVYFALGRRYVERRLRRRVLERALAETALWRKLWQFGGLTLIAEGAARCAAPDGNWMALVRRLAPGARAAGPPAGPP